ncbi:MAG: DUF2807 domain-containing protein [bacterium]
MKNLLFLSTVVLLTVLAGCKKDNNDNDCITGNGNIVQDTRQLADYNAVTASGAYDLVFSQLNASQADLFGDSNVLDIILTTVTNERLFIDTEDDKCYSTEDLIEVYLTSPFIYDFVLNGAGSITASNVQQSSLSFTTNGAAIITSSMTVDVLTNVVNGSGDANFMGEAVQAEFRISGTGSIYASTLNTSECKIVISGAGDVRVHVESKLDVTITGSGNVYYSGDPGTITSNITGTGQLIKEG